MLFKITYILFFFCSFLYGSLQIAGPITPRHLMTLIMLVLCFREGMPKLDKYMVAFLIFTSCFLFSGVVYRGDFADTIKWVFAEHFVAFIAFQSTRILVEKYNGANFLLYTYLCIGILDAVVTIGQYSLGPYAEIIMKVVANNVDDGQLDASEYHGGDSMAGFVPPGLVGSVPNGYLLAATCILSLYNKKARLKLYNICLLCLSFYALFCVQEKTAFVAGGVLSLFLIYKLLMAYASDNPYKKSLVNIGFVTFLFLGLVGLIAFIADNEEVRYNQGFEMTAERNDLLLNAVRFISENPFGGIFEYNRQNHNLPPHNLFLNAFVWGGYLGGLAIMILLYWKGVTVARTLFKPLTSRNYTRYIASLIYVSFTLNSITHNSSVVMGDFYFWAFWAICLFQQDKPEEEKVEAQAEMQPTNSEVPSIT